MEPITGVVQEVGVSLPTPHQPTNPKAHIIHSHGDSVELTNTGDQDLMIDFTPWLQQGEQPFQSKADNTFTLKPRGKRVLHPSEVTQQREYPYFVRIAGAPTPMRVSATGSPTPPPPPPSIIVDP